MLILPNNKYQNLATAATRIQVKIFILVFHF
jgi:hypothetical protein